MSPAVSIILPTFNRLEFLPHSIESVFAQTFTNWELLVADDGSGGDTRAYLQSLHDPPRVSILWLPHSGKPAVARNAALRAAQGDYVAFLDSDDVWLPEKLQAQITSLLRHADRGWSYTRFAVVDASGNPPVPARGGNWPAPTGWILEKLLLQHTVIALPSVIVSRRLLEKLGPFDEDLVMCEDDELWFRLAAHSEVDSVDEPLTLVRRHGQHFGSDVAAWRDRRRVFEKALRAGGSAHLQPVLRRLRAEMSTGLARSQLNSADRLGALGTVLSSAPYSWRYPQWWRGALVGFAPAVLRRAVRRFRHTRSAKSAADMNP
ncbi:MAG: glycosyltransferase family 2 protein [Steroidobacteraceae bacterium]